MTEYAKGATGNAAPVATIAGANTGLDSPQGLALDRDGNLFLANSHGNSVTAYAKGATGNAAPFATISGPRPTSVAVSMFSGDQLPPRRLPSNRFDVSRIRSFRDGTITFSVKVPGPGAIDVLETAWKDNYARAAISLQPAPGRFVYARRRATARRARTIKVMVKPNGRGRRLVAHHRYRVTLRLWVSYTPTGGRARSKGFYGLHLGK